MQGIIQKMAQTAAFKIQSLNDEISDKEWEAEDARNEAMLAKETAEDYQRQCVQAAEREAHFSAINSVGLTPAEAYEEACRQISRRLQEIKGR